MLDAIRTNVKAILSEDCELNSRDALHALIPMFPGGPRGNERSYRMDFQALLRGNLRNGGEKMKLVYKLALQSSARLDVSIISLV